MPSHLKALLPHTWDVFFARHGRFTDIQLQAIKPILAGENCVLVSATASGKTEAALAPLLELLKRETSSRDRKTPGLALLYLVPTRALAKDLERRLAVPMEQLGLRLGVKTGDEPRLGTPDVLITTPESFDSLLVHSPKAVKDVRAVVLDELHLYESSVRGDQLAILLNRLRRIRAFAQQRGESRSNRLQLCALSATIANPTDAAARFFSRPLVIQVPGQRELDAELIELTGETDLRDLFERLATEGARKLLAFCNRRADCESWASLFRHQSPFGGQVFVHYGSLEAKIRRTVETRFGQSSTALCFATSTLELGIDIGDIDTVLLLGAPDSAQAFLQRIGRGNRRTGRTRVFCLYQTEMEKNLFLVLLETALTGELEPTSTFFHPSVVVQQLCSYLKQTQNGEIPLGVGYELFVTPEGAPLLPRDDYNRIIERLLEQQYFTLAPHVNALQPGPVWRKLYEERAIYTNLHESARQLEIIDAHTTRKLGDLEQIPPAPGTHFLFAGNRYETVRIERRKVFVRPSTEPAATLRRPGGLSTHRLTPELARKLTVLLAEELQETAELTQTEGGWLWVHGGGDALAILLRDVLEQTFRLTVTEANSLFIRLEAKPPEELRMLPRHLESALSHRWKQFERWFDLGRFQTELPLEIRRKTVAQALNLNALRVAPLLSTPA